MSAGARARVCRKKIIHFDQRKINVTHNALTQTHTITAHESLDESPVRQICRVEKFIQLGMCYASSNLYARMANCVHDRAVLSANSMVIVLCGGLCDQWNGKRDANPPLRNTSKFKSGLFSLFSFHLILHFCTCNWIVRLEFYCKWQMANKLTNGSFEFDAVSYDALKMNRVYANVYLRSEKQIIFESSRNCEHFILCKFRPLIMTMLLLLRAVNALWCISNYPTTYIVELMCTRSAFACSHLEMVYGIIIDCQVNR